MKNWLRRIRGAVGMGLTWAVEWVAIGLLIGVTSKIVPGLDFFFEIFDAPLPALAIPGFVGGALFSVVLGTAARGRRFSELSLARFTAWGALGGVLLSFVPAALGALGLATANAAHGMWGITAIIIGPLTLMSAASAATTLLLARRSEHRELLEGRDHSAHVGLTDGKAR